MSVDYTIKPDGGAVAAVFPGTFEVGLYRAAASCGLLSPGSNNFRFGFWVKTTDNNSGQFQVICAKFEPSSALGEYFLRLDHVTRTFEFAITFNGTTMISVKASNFGIPANNVWVFVEAWRIGTELGIRVNRGTANTLTIATTAIYSSAGNFMIGGRDHPSYSAVFGWKGSIDEGYFWIANGANELPTSGDSDATYNSGAGISPGELEDLEVTMPYAAWGLEESSGTRYDWVGDKDLSVLGSVTFGPGHIVTADYTLLQTWATDLSSYDGSVAWNALIYGGGDFLGNANYTLTNIQESGTEPITIRAADGQGHGGDPTAGAFTAYDLTIFNSDYVRVEGLRFEGSNLTFDGGGSNTDWRASGNLLNAGYIYILLTGVDLDGLLLENNLSIEAPNYGIRLELDAVTSDVDLDNAEILHNTIIGVDDGDYGIQIVGAETTGEVTAVIDLLNNVVIDAATDIAVSGITNLTLDKRGNFTSDATGETTGLTAAAVFADPSADNYQTKVDGPTYRAGVAAPTLIDILGRSRNSTTPDGGAFEVPFAGARGALLTGVGC